MSEEMAKKKEEELKQFENTKMEVAKEISEDVCPACGLPTVKVEFFNPQLIQTLGWIECTRCGNVYVPKSILKQKRTALSGAQPVSSLIKL